MKLELVLKAVEWMLPQVEENKGKATTPKRVRELASLEFRLKAAKVLLKREATSGELDPYARLLAIVTCWHNKPELPDLQQELQLLGFDYLGLFCHGVFQPEPVTGKDFR